jgi:Zinc finger C-x8-C-x5-C-x3-H type (and similar)
MPTARRVKVRGGGPRAPKSNVCYRFEKGDCSLGDKCRFDHVLGAANEDGAAAAAGNDAGGDEEA